MSQTILEQVDKNKTLQHFVMQDNIELLWNIIIENQAFQNSAQVQSESGKEKLRGYYINQVKLFIEQNLQTTQTLIELNKLFIAQFIRGFKPNISSENESKKIDLSSSTPLEKDVITIEEIKNVRLNEFENKYEQMQNDFNMYRKNDAPEDVEFKDNVIDEPIKGDNEMKNIIVNTLQTRESESSNFIPNNENNNIDKQTRDWLNLKDENITNTTVQENISLIPQQNTNNLIASDNEMIIKSSVSNKNIEELQIRMGMMEEQIRNIANVMNNINTKIDELRIVDISTTNSEPNETHKNTIESVILDSDVKNSNNINIEFEEISE